MYKKFYYNCDRYHVSHAENILHSKAIFLDDFNYKIFLIAANYILNKQNFILQDKRIGQIYEKQLLKPIHIIL